MSKQKGTAFGGIWLSHRPVHVSTGTENDVQGSPATSQTPTTHVDSDPPPGPSTFAKRVHDALSTFSPNIGFRSSLPSPSPQIKVDDTPSTVRNLPLPATEAENGHSGGEPQHKLQSFWSALDRLRSPSSKKPELESPEPSQSEFLDCVDDNNSIMMYGPLEPDETSQVEIACSEIVSVNGDGEEIRTPQPCYVPLPSESFDEVVVGSPARSPLSLLLPLPFESIDQVLTGSGGRSPQIRSPQPRPPELPLGSIDRLLRGDFSPQIRSPQPRSPSLSPGSISRVLSGSGIRSPQSRFAFGSIDQVLTGEGAYSGNEPEKGESDSVSETALVKAPPAVEPTTDQPRVKEYRVWLPSLTKISVQTMWWGFRIYLPPPVLDVLNNKQLEAVKRAAIITTALQWLMDHLPIDLLPPQVRPGVTILRHLVPYVGYMGGFIAWSWTAIRSFDKGYGVVLTATWLLPFLLVPGTWEAEQMPPQDTDVPPSPSVSP